MRRLYTFSAGLPGAPDFEYARSLAEALKCQHHEIRVSLQKILEALPTVIYHLESFDALLVRSSVMNFLAAQEAANYVLSVFSGEGGDELFGGYDYLKVLEPAKLGGELIDITLRLHNTALQRIERSSAAHSLVVYVPFLDPAVVDYAFRIPSEYKLHDGVEKWILRVAMEGIIPEAILKRPKSKFWEGAGVGDLLSVYADEHISTADFERDKLLPNGWRLNSKEELMYYRFFREYFGCLADLNWMGRTKAIVAPLGEHGSS